MRYLLSRSLYMLPVVWLVVSVVFLLIHLVPGDPIQQMLGEGAAATDIAAARHAYGLDVPLGQQYLNYWRDLVHGDMGRSLRLNQNVGHVIAQAYPATMELTLAALLVALGISIPAGVRSALRRNRWDDRVLSFVSLLGLSFPNFALGPILILFFAIELGWLPVSGSGSLAHLVLPAITMGGALAAILTRMIRTSMLEELGQDYIRTARAKGLPERTVVYRHALRNAMIPILTVVGLQFGALLAGAIVTETIFSWPGHWTAHHYRHLQPRLLPGTRLHIDDRVDLRAGELPDRLAVLSFQSKDQAVAAAATLPGLPRSLLFICHPERSVCRFSPARYFRAGGRVVEGPAVCRAAQGLSRLSPQSLSRPPPPSFYLFVFNILPAKYSQHWT